MATMARPTRAGTRARIHTPACAPARARVRRARARCEAAAAAGRARVAAFVSGGGSNLRAIAAHDGFEEVGEVALVVASNASCGGAEWARERGIDVVVWPGKAGTPSSEPAVLLSALESRDVDLVVLAGYLKLVPEAVVRAYERRMLNVHPALLPAFGGAGMYGGRVHAAVVASGARFSGPTVHFVTAEYDEGPIVAQRAVPVLSGDTPESLAARVLRAEHWLYPRVVSAACAGGVRWGADGVPRVAALEAGADDEGAMLLPGAA